MVETTQPHSRARFRIIAMLLPLVVLACVEAGLRLGGFEHQTDAPRYLFHNPDAEDARTGRAAMVPDPDLFWRLRPGLSDMSGAMLVQLSGYRTDFDDEPTQGVRRIACLGDSNTFGLQVHKEEAWPAVVETLLQVEGEKVECLNLGVPGYTSHQGLVLLRRDVLDLRPDVVIMSFGTFNDWIPARGRTDAEQHAGRHMPELRVVQAIAWLLGVRPPEESFELKDLLDNIDTRGYEGDRRVGLDEFESNLREMIDETRSIGAEPMLLASPLPAPTLARNPIATRYADVTRRIATDERVPLIDGWALFSGVDSGREPLFEDFCHPSIRGHAILGAAVAGELSSLR